MSSAARRAERGESPVCRRCMGARVVVERVVAVAWPVDLFGRPSGERLTTELREIPCPECGGTGSRCVRTT